MTTPIKIQGTALAFDGSTIVLSRGLLGVGGISAANLPTGIDAAKIADGSVSNAEFQRLDGVTSAIQTQINGKAASSHTHAWADITSGKPTTLAGYGITDPVALTNAAQAFSATQTVNADLKLGTAGNGLYVKEGSNATMGVATLVGGTVTVNTTKVTANSRIFLTAQVAGGTQGELSVGARVAGTSFVINSASALDTSTVAWMIVEPA